MEHVDVAIIGGGLAGSAAAAMLGRAGIASVVVDPHPVYPPDFRCEKLDPSQVRLLVKTGLAEHVFGQAVRCDETWIARFGQLVEKRRNTQYGIAYQTMVNAVRAQIPRSVPFVPAKVAAISTSADLQRLMLANGAQISARLIVLANGLNSGLRRAVGMVREDLSVSHSISIGFDVAPVGSPAFAFPALTYFPERTADRMAYLTLFPIAASTMRANLFVYREPRDPWLRELRDAPERTLFAALPRLKRLTGDLAVTSDVKVRPVDLYVTRHCRRPGVVVVGDAFATSCPAAGTGVNKVLTDVERLCAGHVASWLATPGMGEDKIAAFYDDPEKVACDAWAADKAHFLRSLSLEAGIAWQARRWGRFVGQLGVGALHGMRDRLAAASPNWPAATAGHSAPR
ncbi:MAG TPA: FAD-dependent monooxygenase [Xanthobacteraceae bacterium]|nr:FAD-dependent monooxygenase [Xanthobacteraceae bacterium]